MTSAIDYSPANGKTNYYKVKAANSSASSPMSAAKSIMVDDGQGGSDNPGGSQGGGTDNPGGSAEEPDEPEELPAPTGVKAYQKGNNIRVEWRAVSGARVYEVYFKGPGYFSYNYTRTENQYIDLATLSLNFQNGDWSIYVIALNSDLEKGEKSLTVSCRYTNSSSTEEPEKLPAPTGLQAYQKGNNIRVEWRAVSGARVYDVYYKGPRYSNYYYFRTEKQYYDFASPNINLKDGNWYFYVIALNSNFEKGEKSTTVSCRYTSSSLGTIPGGESDDNEPSDQ